MQQAASAVPYWKDAFWFTDPQYCEMATGRVFMMSWRTASSGQRNAFQFAMNVKIVTVDRAGPDSGSMICQKMRNSPAPSMRAASCLLYTSDAADDLLCVDLGG